MKLQILSGNLRKIQQKYFFSDNMQLMHISNESTKNGKLLLFTKIR